MTKQEIIGYIMEINKLATREFLETFPVDELGLYLDHLIEIALLDTAA